MSWRPAAGMSATAEPAMTRQARTDAYATRVLGFLHPPRFQRDRADASTVLRQESVSGLSGLEEARGRRLGE